MHQQHESTLSQAGIMASASAYYLGLAIYNAAPSWEMVPPICFGAAALWNAHTNHRQFKARRDKEAAR